MAEENRFSIKIIEPDQVFYEGEAQMVEFNTVEGEVGIYKNHIPMTMILKPGVLRITDGDDVKTAALHEGFVEVLPDSITILAEIVEWPEEIDVERAQAAKERAQKRLAEKDPSTDIARAETALQRSITRIAVIK
ncbi:MAG: ATP synthase F1 subunit epsilon [Lachnospiraceae bacterium]|nr:ATP synthase F1 subunit epsilon [Candidatus Merdinaster equi]